MYNEYDRDTGWPIYAECDRAAGIYRKQPPLVQVRFDPQPQLQPQPDKVAMRRACNDAGLALLNEAGEAASVDDHAKAAQLCGRARNCFALAASDVLRLSELQALGIEVAK